MDKLFDTAIFTRKSLLKIMETRSYEELVKIPHSFKNSIFWNIAHLLVTQQLLCYRLSGLDLSIDEEMVGKYGKGAIATSKVSMEDIDYVRANLLILMDKLKELMSMSNLKEEWQKRREVMLKDKIDVTAFLEWFVLNYPDSVEKVQEDHGIFEKFK